MATISGFLSTLTGMCSMTTLCTRTLFHPDGSPTKPTVPADCNAWRKLLRNASQPLQNTQGFVRCYTSHCTIHTDPVFRNIFWKAKKKVPECNQWNGLTFRWMLWLCATTQGNLCRTAFLQHTTWLRGTVKDHGNNCRARIILRFFLVIVGG